MKQSEILEKKHEGYLEVYTVYDQIAEKSGMIWMRESDAEAVRDYWNAMEKVRHYEDFKLFKLARYNEKTMHMDPIMEPFELNVGKKDERVQS